MEGRVKPGSVLVWTLAYGVVWNALGWAGNNLLLGAAWDAVNARLTPDFAPPYAGLAREGMTLLPDFIYAFGFVVLFGQMREQTVAAALRLALVLELFVIVVYLAMITSGFLPWQIAMKTSLLALVIFLATAPILPLASGRRVSRSS
jgi:hypothetical protein